LGNDRGGQNGGKNVRSSNGQRCAFWIVIVAALGALAGLWWRSTRSADLNFLPGWASAEWIVYSTPPDVLGHPRVELPGLFTTTFDLKEAPPQARLRVAGFQRYALSINGTPVGSPIQAGKTWKQPDVFEVSGRLRSGSNRIDVTVFNSNGPPALWLFLDAGASRVRTGEDWQASYAGATWRSAVLASKSKPVPPGAVIYGGEQPWTSLRTHWPVLLMFALLSAAGCWGIGILQRRFSTRRGDASGRVKSTSDTGTSNRAWILLIAAMAVLWVALFANNVGALPRDRVGFDFHAHLEYVRYIQEHGSLPLAGEGWEMFQPPLYYLLGATLLKLLSLSVSSSGGILALRFLGLVSGMVSIAAVWASIRLLFPEKAVSRGHGLLLAACLPPVLYISQYVSNEAMAAALASTSLFLCLRVLKQERVSWKACAGLGVCLGAALLTKSTNVLLVPAVFGALLWRRLESRGNPVSYWALRMGVIFGLCAVVCGWHYARVWVHYGNPLIGNWDVTIGKPWWQDDGYRTIAYYLRFGEALRHPWYAGFSSYADGLYSTLWGDGLLGGVGGIAVRPLWNYDLMSIGYWLSLLPMLAVGVGAIRALFAFIRRPSAEWFLLLGFGFLITVALAYMSLVVPCGGQSKAFYGLPALVPFCTVGAWGLSFLGGRNRYWRFILSVLLGLWAINSFASFWIVRSSVCCARTRGQILISENQFIPAADFLKARLESDPGATELRLILVTALFAAGDLNAVERELQTVAQEEPDNGEMWVWRASLLRQRQQIDQALETARRGVELLPGSRRAYQQLGAILMKQKRYKEAVRIARQGVGMTPYSVELRVMLGTALLFTGREGEALAQLQYAFRFSARSIERFNNLAWELATNGDPDQRNGAVAAKLADLACVLTGYRQPAYLNTLAAAEAEAGRYDDAMKTAERARVAALASGRADLVVKTEKMMVSFKSGQPYQEKKSQ
jgi:tetratricopeptide (TPR) repeat protein